MNIKVKTNNNLFFFSHTNIGDKMNEIFEVILRAFVSLVTLFIMTKILGKKQVSQLSLFDYVIGISIGNFAAEITINLEANMIYGVIGVVIFGLFSYLVSILTMKSMVLRRFFMGTPTLLIENGKICLDGLKKVKFDINDLLEECRNNGYFDLSKINYALMEANGKLSVLPFFKEESATKGDMNIKGTETSLCANVIIDGKIMHKNLKNFGKTENWLIKQLKNNKVEDVLLGTVDNTNTLKIYFKEKAKLKDILE